MTSVLAPVLPHLAEEIYNHTKITGENSELNSFFTTKWTKLVRLDCPLTIPIHRYSKDSDWEDLQAEQDMADLFRLRGVVLYLLEKARGQK